MGTARNDRLVGTRGRDVIVGLGGDDRIDGRGGNDLICGGDGADTLTGGSGDDRLESGRQSRFVTRSGQTARPDYLEGGPGDDVLVADRDPRPFYDGSSTTYVTFRHSPHGVRVDLSDGHRGKARGLGQDTLVEKGTVGLIGSPHDDRLTGSPGPDQIYGGTGDDVVRGMAGDDHLTGDPAQVHGRLPQEHDVVLGGDGNDLLRADTGHDELYGGAGDDTFYALSPEPTQSHGEAGDDRIETTVTQAAGFVSDGGEGRDTTVLGAFGSPVGGDVPVIVRTGPGTVERGGQVLGQVVGDEVFDFDDAYPVQFFGTDAAEEVDSAAPLRAWTMGGDDVVTGSVYDDYIDAGAGADAVSGSNGTDTCLNAERVSDCERLTP